MYKCSKPKGRHLEKNCLVGMFLLGLAKSSQLMGFILVLSVNFQKYEFIQE